MFDEMDIEKPIKIENIKKGNNPLLLQEIPLFYFNPQKKIMIMKPFTPKFKKFHL